ncbi:MAG: lamin tail domain-containing protein [Saprospiraceae bacterium]
MKKLLPFFVILISLNLSAQDLVINEFLASNDAIIADQDGEFEDWIELYNNSNAAINLAGYALSDDDENLAQWAFPAGTTIPANGYLVIWADNDEEQAGLHANFKLSGGGETIYLTSATGAFVDTIEYKDQTTDISFGRIPNGTGDFQVMKPTFNAENIADSDGDGIDAENDCNDADASIGAKQAAGTTCNDAINITQADQIQSDGCTCIGIIPAANGLVINEIMASNGVTMADQDGEFEDWIELYNNGSASIDLAGYYLSDNINNWPKWTFTEGITIAANGYVTVWADEDGMQEGLHANFKLSASAESVYLVSPIGELIDQINYADQKKDVGFGRNPNGTGDFQKIIPTFNAQNSMTTSIDAIELAPIELTANPNPVSQTLNLRVNELTTKKRAVVIYNLTGKAVYEATILGTTQIDVSAWIAGIYVVRVGGHHLKIVVR